MLGYALPGGGRDLYGDILPYDEVEGSDAQALGCLQSFTEALFGLDDRLRETRSWAEWAATLVAVLADFSSRANVRKTNCNCSVTRWRACGPMPNWPVSPNRSTWRW